MRVRPAMHPMSFLAATIGASAVLVVPLVGWELAAGHHPVLEARTFAAFGYVAVFPSRCSPISASTAASS